MPESSDEFVLEVGAAGTTLTLHCDLSFSVEREFKKVCDELLDSKGSELLVNLAEVHYICSSCIGVLLLLHEDAKDKGKRVRVRASRSIAPICQLMGLDDVLELEVVE